MAWSSSHSRRTRRWHDDEDISTSRSWPPCGKRKASSTLWNIHRGQRITCQHKTITVTQRAPLRPIPPLRPSNSADSSAVFWIPFAYVPMKAVVVFLISLTRRHLVNRLRPARRKDLEDLKKSGSGRPFSDSLDLFLPDTKVASMSREVSKLVLRIESDSHFSRRFQMVQLRPTSRPPLRCWKRNRISIGWIEGAPRNGECSSQ